MDLIKNFLKNKGVMIMIIAIIILSITIIMTVLGGGYTFSSMWFSLSKKDKLITKIKAQTNYSIDMKKQMKSRIGSLYEVKLKEYIKEEELSVPYPKIESDVKDYKKIVIKINDNLEDLTLSRYIYNNDLYRYSNPVHWKQVKDKAIQLFSNIGRDILINNYEHSKMTMPLKVWIEKAHKELQIIIKEETYYLMDSLKMESDIYYKYHNGRK
jgi:hypothetical protein